MNPKVDTFFLKLKKWKQESEKLRSILLDSPLTEELKWGQPCYTLGGKNVVLIGGFKDYCALLFFKGAVLPDLHRLLVAPGQVQAGRQIRFTSLEQIKAMEGTVRVYIHEAIEAEKAGLKVKLKKHAEYVVPVELQKRLDARPALKRAFESLTPGRQRAYMLHVAAPKLPATRESRVEKCVPLILEGKGLND